MLPVRPHVFAASRLGAAVIVGTVFSAAVNVPAAALYSLFAAGHPIFGWNVLGLFLGHTLATMSASLFMLCALLVIRGSIAVCFGAGAGRWIGAALQLISVVLMFEAFFFLPGILGMLAAGVMHGDAAITAFPPVWFAALHTWLIGHANQMLQGAMLTGLAWFTATALILVPLYLLPARWLGQRALEKRSRERAAATTFVVRTIAALTGARPPARGLFLFAVASLVRSRRHVLVLASYGGLAVAVSIISIWLIDERGSLKLNRPASWILTLPMLFLFFGILGLRASCRIPTEVEANWPFRIAPPSLATCVNATVLLMFTLTALPASGVTAILLAPYWPLASVVIVMALQMLAALVLIEVLLLRWRHVPFACVHAPSPDVLKAWWPVYAVALYVYAFRVADWQFAATSSPRALAWYVAVGALVVATARLLRAREMGRHQLEFDDDGAAAVERLNLSEALN